MGKNAQSVNCLQMKGKTNFSPETNILDDISSILLDSPSFSQLRDSNNVLIFFEENNLISSLANLLRVKFSEPILSCGQT